MSETIRPPFQGYGVRVTKNPQGVAPVYISVPLWGVDSSAKGADYGSIGQRPRTKGVIRHPSAKGATYFSLGQRPRKSDGIMPQALKGRPNTHIVCRSIVATLSQQLNQVIRPPFQGYGFNLSTKPQGVALSPQGVALGYISVPLWGVDFCAKGAGYGSMGQRPVTNGADYGSIGQRPMTNGATYFSLGQRPMTKGAICYSSTKGAVYDSRGQRPRKSDGIMSQALKGRPNPTNLQLPPNSTNP